MTDTKVLLGLVELIQSRECQEFILSKGAADEAKRNLQLSRQTLAQAQKEADKILQNAKDVVANAEGAANAIESGAQEKLDEKWAAIRKEQNKMTAREKLVREREDRVSLRESAVKPLENEKAAAAKEMAEAQIIKNDYEQRKSRLNAAIQ